MAKRLQLDEDYLLALCAYEHGWENAHNDLLHNLFGITKAGANNLAFSSDQESCDYWQSHFGGVVRGSSNMSMFVSRLRTIPYNTVRQDYDQTLLAIYQAVVRYKSACGFAGL